MKRLAKIIQISAPVAHVYETWRRVEEFPRFFDSVTSVLRLPDGRTDWAARGPFGKKVRWQAMVTEDVPATRLRWQSLGGDLSLRGLAEFIPAEGGTVALIVFEYQPHFGFLGWLAASLAGVERRLERELTHLKEQVELGQAEAPAERRRLLHVGRSHSKGLLPSTVSNAT